MGGGCSSEYFARARNTKGYIMRVVIAVDDASMITSATEESNDIAKEIRQQCECELEVINIDPLRLGDSPSADIYVVDFGGLGVGYGSYSEPMRCTSELVKKIENCPGSLFLIWTQFTFDWYENYVKDELQGDIGFIPNNVLLYRYGNENKFWDKVRTWVGIDRPGEP